MICCARNAYTWDGCNYLYQAVPVIEDHCGDGVAGGKAPSSPLHSKSKSISAFDSKEDEIVDLGLIGVSRKIV